MEHCALQLGEVKDADFDPIIYWHERHQIFLSSKPTIRNQILGRLG
jgi:hypothetical protein